MMDAQRIADHYIAVWNEPDATRRRSLLEQTWAADASYTDPLMAGSGLTQIDGLINAVHERFPGFRFQLDSLPDGYADKLRFSWILGSESEPDMIKGTDFVTLEDGRLKSVIGFIDKAPSA